MSTRTETTTSNSNTQSVEPWGPMQAPLEKNINMLNNLSGDKQWFRKANPGQFQQAFNMYDYAANMNNRGQDYFTPLHTQQQVSPLLQGAQGDVQTGGGALTDYANNAGQVDAAGRGDQWQQWQDNFLGDSNPYLDQVISDSFQDVSNQINQQFTGAGRSYGSGAYADVMADRLGKIATQTRYDDYRRRYDQERGAFTGAMNQADQYGYGAANQLYGTGTNTVLQGSQAIDNQERARIADIERVNANRANMMLQSAKLRQQHDYEQRLEPHLLARSWPLAQLTGAGGRYATTSGSSTASQSQPNNNFWPGLVSAGAGIFGGFF